MCPGDSNCTTNADCGAGMLCDKAVTSVKCSCKATDGTDSCVSRGVCKSFCSTQQGMINIVNAMVPECGTAGNIGVFDNKCGQGEPLTPCPPMTESEPCWLKPAGPPHRGKPLRCCSCTRLSPARAPRHTPAGFECKASTRCRQLACDSTGLYTTPCFGLCTASQRTILSAKLDSDGRTIRVALSTRAADNIFPCSNLFDAATATKLGLASSICTASGTQLTIWLARDATIVPDNTLVLLSGQTVLTDAMTTAAEGRFTTPATAIKLTRCDNCDGPVVALNGPKVTIGATCRSPAAGVTHSSPFQVVRSGRLC